MKRVILILLAMGVISSCATDTTNKQIVLGSDICAGEASQVYFPSFSDSIDIAGAQVINGVVDALKVCGTRKISLVSVSGNDGVASPALLTKRADLVKGILVDRGIAADRMDVQIDGRLVKKAPPAPIGRVYILTR
jgi:outer membrane protein OmpA-like peptidoglycan-associated protein